jgi:hypothetical protein
MGAQSLPTTWAIQATLMGTPNILMFEAESEYGGVDAGDRMNKAMAEIKLQQGVDHFKQLFDGMMKKG